METVGLSSAASAVPLSHTRLAALHLGKGEPGEVDGNHAPIIGVLFVTKRPPEPEVCCTPVNPVQIVSVKVVFPKTIVTSAFLEDAIALRRWALRRQAVWYISIAPDTVRITQEMCGGGGPHGVTTLKCPCKLKSRQSLEVALKVVWW